MEIRVRSAAVFLTSMLGIPPPHKALLEPFSLKLPMK
jgi:hypothetical protein